MKVQARFYVAAVNHVANHMGNNGQVTLYPITRGPENKSWAQATPTGKIELGINSDALGWFFDRLGKDVAITFEDRPLICPDCNEELSGDQYAGTSEPVPGTDGAVWHHRGGHCPTPSR